MFDRFRRLGLRQALLTAMMIAAFAAFAAPVTAQGRLPEPYVSPALDAVLMPITPAVKEQFKLPKAATGVVVASVQPGGVGELFGFEPGEVISRVDNKLIRRPVDLDSIVAYGVDNGESLFVFDGLWKGRKQRTIAQIDGDGFRAPVSFDRADRWPGYRGRGFDYARWYTPYAPRVQTVWDDTFTYIAAVIITDVFLDALRSDQAVFYFVDDRYYWAQDEYYITDVDQVFYSTYSEEVYSVTYTEEVYESYYEETFVETYSEETYYEETAAYSEESVTEETVTDEAYSDEMVTEDATLDEGTADDASAEGVDADAAYDDPVDDEQAYEEPAAEEQTYDEQAYEEPAAEEQVFEEQAYEEPAAEEQVFEEQTYEEPAAEEQVFEEPAYEEPAYEEPAYDGGGEAECPVDEDGNLMCQ
ncbi:MAG: hypothetical protein CFE34_03540 [Rhodobacteraceae bacterium PARR1]|nr:MAG: hypothetical protein CFE34_03540 [Rhodobacteraceae bacterium PARR1]